ncbi:membrane protein [Fulvitalea axinellae]|uniref:Membrane protein n=1 Tax=Fulvitalea axinellae TaxID=1182444 RepID=A0AAU9D5B6_9BACT|nr:membrane protein [Fulvitalea axinellae]
MDSLTQIVLGAAVGEIVGGKRLGNKAPLWGAVAGTIPDLDILFAPHGAIAYHIQHRGFSHSILFAILMAPLLGAIFSWLYRKRHRDFKLWTSLFFWGIFTHPLLDAFTTWGTSLFLPFSRYRVAFKTIFVIDPIYTVPFLICIAVLLFFKRQDPRRRRWAWAGVSISSAYLALTVFLKIQANRITTKALREQGITYTSYMTTLTPLNSLLWAGVAKTEKGYYTGYFSLLDREKKINFHFRPNGLDKLPKSLLENQSFRELPFITEGFYTVTESGDEWQVQDLRFGQLNGWEDPNSPYVMTMDILKKDGSYIFERGSNSIENPKERLLALFDRIF